MARNSMQMALIILKFKVDILFSNFILPIDEPRSKL